MLGIYALIFAIIIVALAIALMPQPKPISNDSDFEAPTTEIGTPIGVLFGRKRIIKPILSGYFGVKIIKVKADSGGKK